MRIFRMANPSPHVGGGGLRAYNVLKHMPKFAEVVLVPPVTGLCRPKVKEELKELVKNYKIHIPEGVYDYLGQECKPIRNPILLEKRMVRYYMNFINEAKDSDVLFCDHEGFELAKSLSYLKEKTGGISVLLIQAAGLKELKNLIWNFRVRGFNIKTILKYIRNIYSNKIFKKSTKNLDLLLGVSNASIQDLLDLKLVRNDIPHYVLRPSNAFDEELLNYSTLDKENYAIFFARLVPEKGIFDLPKIWKLVREELTNSKLIILGRFFNETVKRKFLSMIRNDPSIEYKGFVTREELYKIISKARVTIYPSYFDSFSLVALESLALKTPIVAYDIPALREFYSNIKAVRLVEPKNYKAMASEVVKLLRMKTEDYQELFDDKYEEFIKLHSSWERVAKEEFKAIKEFLEKKS